MEIFIAATAITGLGYFVKDRREKAREIKTDELLLKNEKASGEDIYNSRHLEKVGEDELKRATSHYVKSFRPEKYGVVNHVYKDRRQRFFIPEEEIINTNINPHTKDPSSVRAVINTSNNHPTYEHLEAEDTKTFNERRNTLQRQAEGIYYNYDSKENFENNINGTSGNGLVIKKGVKVWKGHNNMTPFFGGNLNQNVNPAQNKAKLELFTGADPIFKHKDTVKRMFPVFKNPYAATGLPVSANRQEERYVTSLMKNGVKPFQETRVAPGLQRDFGSNTDIGFHDMYRPRYKDVNELRVNPKLSYKSRTAGAPRAIVANASVKTPVLTRRQIDLTYDTMPMEGPSELLGGKTMEQMQQQTVQNRGTDWYGVNGRQTYFNQQNQLGGVNTMPARM